MDPGEPVVPVMMSLSKRALLLVDPEETVVMSLSHRALLSVNAKPRSTASTQGTRERWIRESDLQSRSLPEERSQQDLAGNGMYRQAPL